MDARRGLLGLGFFELDAQGPAFGLVRYQAQEALPGAGFSQNQNRGIGGGHLLHAN